MALATSSGLPHLPKGWMSLDFLLTYSSLCSLENPLALKKSVSMTPGLTELTLIPLAAKSMAEHWVKWSKAAYESLYAKPPG